MERSTFHFQMMGKGESFYCFIQMHGKLTHEEYQTFVPLFNSALKGVKVPKVKVLADISNLQGWELQAAWDDLKFGLSHNNDFSQIAVVGDNKLYEYGVKVSNWFTPYEMKFFNSLEEAKEWLQV